MLDLHEQSTGTISNILTKYLIEHKIDKDGDIAIDSPIRTYIKVIPEKGVLRFMSFIHKEAISSFGDDAKNKFVKFVNSGSYTVKYSLMSNGSIICEYGIVMSGMADENFIIKCLKNFEKEVLSTKNMSSNQILIKNII